MRWLLLSLFCLLAVEGRLAAAMPVIRSWQTEDGLPSDKVNTLAQSQDGYLWIGTSGGLARFDGNRFVAYDARDGLVGGNIQHLLADRDGRLWITVTGAGIYWFRDGVFTKIGEAEGLPGGLSGLVLGADGAIYGSCSGGLARFADGKFSVEAIPDFIGRRRPSGLLASKDGTIWGRFSKSGLWAWRKGTWSQPSDLPADLKADASVMTEDVAGNLWVGFEGQRLWRRDSSGWRAVKVQNAESGYFQTMAAAREGGVWVAVAGGGLWRVQDDASVPVPLSDSGLVHSIEQLMVDRGGQLWAGTLQSGLLRVSESKLEVGRISEAGGAGLVRSLAEISPGEFVVGTMHHGTFRWQDGKSERFDAKSDLAGYIFCNALLRTKDGALWLGLGNGLHCYRDGRRVTERAFALQFYGDSVRALLEVHDGSVLAGCSSGRVYCVRNGKAEVVPDVGGAFVWALARTSDGALWVAMRGNGVQRVSTDGVSNFGAADGLRSEIAVALHVDSRGTLWVGTEGGGLACWRNGRFLSLGTVEGLPEDTVSQIIDDGAGRLWLGGNRGIAGVEIAEIEDVFSGRAKTVHPVTFGRGDGMLSAACWPMVAIKASDGQLCFGTTRGFVRFHPSKAQSQRLVPRPCIEEVVADGAMTELHRSGEPFSLAPGTQHLEVRYTGLDVRTAEDIRFRYRLSGLEKEWVDVGSRRFASYALLPPGRYRFEVQASIVPREWSIQPAVLELVVEPHFWQTAWFAGLVGFTVLLGVAGTVRIVERRRSARQVAALERQHAVDAERARIARDLHDDLGGSLTEMALLSELAQANLGDQDKARSHLDRIFNSARGSARALDEIVWAADPARDNLNSFVAYVGEFAQTFAVSAGLRCRFDAPTVIPAMALSAPVRHHLYLAVKEALNNVAKHSGAEEVRLRVAIHDEMLQVAVEDDGKGFSLKVSESPGADGLANMQRRIEEVGGAFNLRSSSDQGTTVEFTLPLKRLGQ